MNPILEKWLEEKQSEERAKKQEFLIKQGLVDPNKTIKVFTDAYGKVLTEEEAKQRKESGLKVETKEICGAVDLTDDEYQTVLSYVHADAGEPSDRELLKKISKNTSIISTIMIIYVILSVIVGIIIAFS